MIHKVILICFLLITLSNAGKSISMTCGTCKSKTGCLSNLCQSIVGEGLNIEECAGISTCPNNGVALNFELGSCSTDYSGASCSTGACYYMSNANMCIPSYTSASLCSTSFWVSTSCGACSKTPSCSQCITSIISTVSNFSVESCVDTAGGCGNIPTSNVTMAQCPNGLDTFGSTCNCCAAVSITANNNIGMCTSTIPALASSTSVNSWAKS